MRSDWCGTPLAEGLAAPAPLGEVLRAGNGLAHAGVVGLLQGDRIAGGESRGLDVAGEHVHHAFTALVQVVQTGFTPGATATITGLIFDGWHAGQRVAGEYTQVACPQSPGDCFAGTLDIFRGSIWD